MAAGIPLLATLGVELSGPGHCVVDIAAAVRLSQCSSVNIKVEQQHKVDVKPDYICGR